jgi:hypothetical protein
MPKTTPQNEALDVVEIIGELDMSAGLLATAEQSFIDLSAIFEAIVEAAPKGSLSSRLAQLGVNLTGSLECDFEEYSARQMSHVERYSAAIEGHPFRRLQSAQDSVKVSV